MGLVPWIQYNEDVIGHGHPTLIDVDNRPLRTVMSISNKNPDTDFAGFVSLNPLSPQVGIMSIGAPANTDVLEWGGLAPFTTKARLGTKSSGVNGFSITSNYRRSTNTQDDAALASWRISWGGDDTYTITRAPAGSVSFVQLFELDSLGTAWLSTSIKYNNTFGGEFDVEATTDDGADTADLSLAGGGNDNTGRGAVIKIAGNENTSQGPGVIDLFAGGVAGGEITIHTGVGVLERLRITDDGNIAILGAGAFQSAFGSFGGGVQVMFIANANTVPVSNPSGGGVMYVEAGALKYRGPSGAVTTMGAA